MQHTNNTKSRGTILIVDDNPANLQTLSKELLSKGYSVRAVPNGELALQSARTSKPELILLDILMPEMNGFEVCKILKDDPDLADVPVIFISALNETVDKVTGFRIGGVDYITKPFQFEEVLVRVETQLTLYRQRLEIQRRHEQDILYSERLNSLKDDIINMTSHDLKNPLASVMLSLDLLRRHGRTDDEDGVRYLSNIEYSINQMSKLISDLLDIAKIETGRAVHPAPVEVAPFVERLVGEFRFRAVQDGVLVSAEPVKPDLIALFDPDRMWQVLSNLLSNAVKYSDKGGTVILATDIRDDEIIFSVEDKGLGIPEETLPNLFDRFYRVESDAHRNREGTGLGLYIAKSIVDQHDGRIWVESKVNEGSTFYVALPLPA